MAGLRTEGFGLSTLQKSPDVPSNVGKLDVQAIYDRTRQGLETAEALDTSMARQAAVNEEAKARVAQSQALETTAPAQAQADVATARRQQLLASPTITSSEATNKLAGLDADLAAEQLRRSKERALLLARDSMTPAQQVIFDQNGPSTTTAGSVQRTPAGQLLSSSTKSAKIGNETVPIATQTSESPSTPLITPISANGQPIGAAVSSVGPDGKQSTHVAPIPFGALAKQATGGTFSEYVGPQLDAQTGKPIADTYYTYTPNAVGGLTKSAKPISVAFGSPAPGRPLSEFYGHGATQDQQAPAGAQPSPQTSQGAQGTPTAAAPTDAVQSGGGRIAATLNAKNRLDTLNELATERTLNDSAQVNVNRIENAVNEMNKDSLLPNYVAGKLAFIPSVQNLNAAVSQFAQDIVQKFKGAGRVTQQEVNFAKASYPQPEQAESVQRKSIQYLKNFVDTVNNRINYEFKSVRAGTEPYDARIEASQKFPIPPPDLENSSTGNNGDAKIDDLIKKYAQPKK